MSAENRTISIKSYPLRIEHYCDDSCEAVSFFTKGHNHDPERFRMAAAEDMKEKGIEGIDLSNHPIACRWYRKRPLLPHELETFGYWVEDAEPGTPGAFPAMEIYVG